MSTQNRNRAIATCAAVLLAAVAPAFSGDLTPPAGPIAPTHKTLTEVEPRFAVNSLPGNATATHIISQPGSYMLTKDVIGEAGKDGIKVTATSGPVAIDLNGFSLRGVTGSGNGLKIMPILHPVELSEGTITGWGGHGVDATGIDGIKLHDLAVLSCAARGLRVGGNATIADCRIGASGLDGVLAGAGSRVDGCSIVGSGQDGLSLGGASCLVRNCVIEGNLAAGLVGPATAAHLVGNTVCGNAIGIHGQPGASNWTIRDTLVSGNTGAGVQLDDGGAVLSGCHVMGNGGAGITAGGSRTRIGGTKVSANGAEGIHLLPGSDHSAVLDTTVSGNTGHGIMMDGQYDIAEGCSVSGNSGAAILGTGGNSTLRGVTVSAAGVTGITSLVTLGQNATVESLVLHDSGSMYIGPVVDASAGGASLRGLTVKVSGATAAAVVRIGGQQGEELGGQAGSELSATNCTLTTALVDVVSDKATLSNLKTAALGTTTAPVLVKISGANNTVLDCRGWHLGDSVPIGADISGNSNTVHGLVINNVPAGGTGLRGIGASNLHLEDVSIHLAGDNSTGMQMTGSDNSFDEVEIHFLSGNNSTGLQVTGANNSFDEVEIHFLTGDNSTGMRVDGPSNRFTEVEVCFLAGNTTTGVVVAGGAGNRFHGVNVSGEVMSSRGFDIEAGAGDGCSFDEIKVTFTGAGTHTGFSVGGGNGHSFEEIKVTLTAGGPHTGIMLGTNDHLVIRNLFRGLMGGTAVVNNGTGNLVGPIVDSGNFGTGCDPCANIRY